MRLIQAQLALPNGCQEAFRVQALTLHNQYRVMHAMHGMSSISCRPSSITTTSSSTLRSSTHVVTCRNLIVYKTLCAVFSSPVIVRINLRISAVWFSLVRF